MYFLFLPHTKSDLKKEETVVQISGSLFRAGFLV
jgi:hypothetical protein